MRPVDITFTQRPFTTLTLMEFHDLVRLREEVFVVSQRITAEAEFDGKDPEALHVLARDGAGRMVATARLFEAARPIKVGRICVLPELQGQGLGTRLMEHVHSVLGARPAAMSAQAHLVPWYASLGWQPTGGIYDECGIPHQRLTRNATA